MTKTYVRQSYNLNGVTVHAHDDGSINFDGPYSVMQERLHTVEVEALAPVFRAQRDLDLGRWRSEVKRHMVVYPLTGHYDIRVMNEITGHGVVFKRSGPINPEDGEFSYTALAYFNAHPPKDPWELAEHGEVWVLTDTDGTEAAFTMDRSQPEFHPNGVWRNMDTYRPGNSDSIREATRIYPKEA